MIRPHLMVLTFLLAAPGSVDASQYTLPALIDRVQHESPGVVSVRASVAMRRAQVLEQQLRWLPEGETAFRAGGAPNVRCIDNTNDCRRTNVVDLERAEPGTSLADRGPFAGPNLSWGLQLRQPLFTSMKIENAIASARAGQATTEADLRTAELDVEVSAVRIFTQIKSARAALATLETTIGVLAAFSAHVERELDGKNSGRYTESDQIRMRIMTNNMKLQIVDQNRNLRAAVEALRALTGDPQADVDESELDWQDRQIEEQSVWRARMLDSRPEMQYARAGMKYYRAWRRLNLGWALPDFALVTSLGWGYSPTFDIPNLGFVNLPFSALGGGLGFAMRQALDLGQKLNHYFQIRHEEAMQQSRFKLGIAWWTVEVDKAWLDFAQAQRTLGENRRGQRLTQGWYALVDENLALGLAPDGRELVEVMLNWSGFRMRMIQSIADTMVALATLRRLSGQPILDKGAL